MACSRHSQSCFKIKHNQAATTQRDAWLVNGLLQNTSDSIATIRCTACLDSSSNFALWCIHDDVLDQLFLHRDFSIVRASIATAAPSCTILTRLTWISWLVCHFPRHLVVVSRQQSSKAKPCFQRLVPPTPSLSMAAPAVPVQQPLVVTHRRVQVPLPFEVPLLHVVAAFFRDVCEVHGIPPIGFHFRWCLGTHPHLYMCIRTFVILLLVGCRIVLEWPLFLSVSKFVETEVGSQTAPTIDFTSSGWRYGMAANLLMQYTLNTPPVVRPTRSCFAPPIRGRFHWHTDLRTYISVTLVTSACTWLFPQIGASFVDKVFPDAIRTPFSSLWPLCGSEEASLGDTPDTHGPVFSPCSELLRSLARQFHSAAILHRRSSKIVFLQGFETVTSWEHCIDHNTASARLSQLG